MVAPSLDTFGHRLQAFREFATGRANPGELDENPPTEREPSEFLARIGDLTNHEPEPREFWAVQIDVDLDVLDS